MSEIEDMCANYDIIVDNLFSISEDFGLRGGKGYDAYINEERRRKVAYEILEENKHSNREVVIYKLISVWFPALNLFAVGDHRTADIVEQISFALMRNAYGIK